MTFVITLHGVLQQPSGAPNPLGIALYRTLVSSQRVAVLGGLDREKDEWFLATQGLTDHPEFLPESIEADPTELGRRLAQVRSLRARGAHVDLVVEPDPEIAARLYEESVPILLFLHPQFSNPAFRPDYTSTARPWAELVESVNYQERLKASVVIPEEEADEE